MKGFTKYRQSQERIPRFAFWGLGGFFGLLALILLAVYLLSRSSSHSPVAEFGGLGGAAQPRVGELTAPKAFLGGTYKVSDVAAVASKNAVLFIDPTKPNYVFWMNLNENGEQVGEIKPLPLGATVQNPRGLTQLGSRYLIVGDLAVPAPAGTAELVSFTVNADTQSIASVQSLTGLRGFLLENVPELKRWATETREEGGFFTEALALSLDPQSPKLLLGCRRPLINGNALVIPLRFAHPGEPITLENLQLAQPNAYQLRLAGQGIRGFRYDNRLKSHLIISGASGEKQDDSFTLWEWNGESMGTSGADPQKLIQLDGAMLPGGLTRVKIAQHEYLFIVGEGSTYAKVEYAKE
ncbi:MAG TPA: DUF3616 domain-containing protein [Blastocatellia bacterium]|nr:DUF3616 domain-containing protein [Blastocatellia bacterium]